MSELEENFCAHCGRSVRPLDGIHVEKDCDECSRQVYVAEPGADGTGIQVESGDRITIPEGAITLSLDPEDGGRFTRQGLSWFIQKLLISQGIPDSGADFRSVLDVYDERAEQHLKNSELLKDLDLDSEDGMLAAWDRVKEKVRGEEFWAFLMGSSSEKARGLLESTDGNVAYEIARAVHVASVAHSLYMMTGEHIQEALWKGYEANRFEAEVENATARTLPEVRVIDHLRRRIANLDEGILHTWVNDDQPIGPRLALKVEYPEDTLKALCQFYLEGFERQREEERRKRDDSRERKKLILKTVSVTATVMTALAGLLKYLGIL
jgi:hypothetical protein